MIRARAPLRISFGGGGTDILPYYMDYGGGVLSATINRFAYVTLIPHSERIQIVSLDYDSKIDIAKDEELYIDGDFDIAKAVVNYFRQRYGKSFGCNIYLHNEAPPGSGLGSSSAIVVALISAVARYLKIVIEPYELAELAIDLERNVAGIKGGKQDQYATVFGGFNYIEFLTNRTIVHPLRLRDKTVFELEYSLAFAYVGGSHEKLNLIDEQIASYDRRELSVLEALHKIKFLGLEMKESLLLSDLSNLASQLDEAWLHKKRISSGISNNHIDNIYEVAKKAGALGGKISGAGGGGFMFFLCGAHKKYSVQTALKDIDVEVLNVSFCKRGAESWNI